MNIKEELNKRIFGWMDDFYTKNNIDPADPKMTFDFTIEHMEELENLDKENQLKYNIVELPEQDNGVYGICKGDTVVRLPIRNKIYYVAVGERLYCEAGVWKWRCF